MYGLHYDKEVKIIFTDTQAHMLNACIHEYEFPTFRKRWMKFHDVFNVKMTSD